MAQELHCKACGKYMAELRDARVRNGMVVYCAECDKTRNQALAGASLARQARPRTSATAPDQEGLDELLRIFGGGTSSRRQG